MGMMVLFRCLHPPGGAIALAAVVGGPAIHQLGYRFIFWPVLGNALLLLASAVAFNAITGRVHANPSKLSGGSSAGDESQGREAGAISEDIDVVKGNDKVSDVDRNVRADIFRGAEFRSDRQRAEREVCEDVTTRDIVAISPDTTLAEALSLLRIAMWKRFRLQTAGGRLLGSLCYRTFRIRQVGLMDSPIVCLHRRPGISLMNGEAAQRSKRYPLPTASNDIASPRRGHARWLSENSYRP
jgi:CBS domain-containing membrane protein